MDGEPGGLARILIVLGLGIVLVGVGLLVAGKLGLGRLPGDVVYRKGNFTFYFPLATSILLSVLLTIVLRLLRR